jgi:DNA-binding response OmpR family regulator
MTTLKILVVDDDIDVADSLADVLELRGHDVTTVYDSAEAVKAFTRERFDIAFMDVMMPGKNGVESFLEIRKIKPDARVVMMTGFSVQHLLDQALEQGAAGVLHKPVAVDDILAMLDGLRRLSEARALVLVADSDADFAEDLRQRLLEGGHAARIANTGQEALAIIGDEPLDLLILELELPVISGLEVYYEMKRLNRVVPTIILSAGPKDHDGVERCLRDPAISGILFKPFDPSVLMSSLDGLFKPGSRHSS